MSNLNPRHVDNVYYNAVINNPAKLPDGSDNPNLIQCEFSQEHLQPIIGNPSEYYLAVERFNIPGNSLPLFPFRNNFYSVTLSYGGDDYRVFLNYVPVTSPGFDPVSQPVYYYSQMVQSINNAFLTAYLTLKAFHPGAPDYPPELIFSPGSQLFSFIVPRTYDPLLGPTTEIYLNYKLGLFFENIPFFSFSRNDPSGKDSLLIVRNALNNYYPVNTDPTVNYVSPTATYPAYQFTSAFPYFRAWNQLKSIVITTQSIPCRREIVATNLTDQTGFINSLTDFTPQVNTNGDVLSTFYFFPQGPRRLIDLTDNNPMYRFDFRIFWSTFTGDLFPLMLNPGNEASIKFLFIKRALGNPVNSGTF
jgi:hypothetical protein